MSYERTGVAIEDTGIERSDRGQGDGGPVGGDGSERAPWRLLAYREEGAAAVHRNSGRKPAATTCLRTQQKVMQMAEGPYAGLNHTHLTEMLAEREGIALSRSTVRRILHGRRGAEPPSPQSPQTPQTTVALSEGGDALQISSRHDRLQGLSDGRRRQYGPGRPVQAAGRCPGLHVDAQGDHRAPWCPSPVQ